ncbi:MAG: serine/threonine protein kinase [Planctomycetaceae bacterium]|nr:serine/threonine protein kinase [Planctomycetaceae bacterium]
MTDAPIDDAALSLLDAYLGQLQAGQRPDRVALLREHPELRSALNCLDALEMLAPPANSSPGEDFKNVATNGSLPRDFGPYELIREIGRGGMGVVYEARQKGLDRSVAVKMILAGHLASPELVRRFQAEAKAAARLRHSNIVHIHEVGQFNGQDFFAMEYIAGQSLAERVAAGPTDPAIAVRLVATVARAVEHLHQQAIIHRDLKPSNILIDAEGQPYVTDFGLAKVFLPGSDATATGVIAGTPSYMAPEQASGRHAAISPATDVYSLGAILYELLTGVPPFHAETAIDTLMEVLSGDPPKPRMLNARIPIGLELICLKCLSKEPAERYASAAALADDLDRFARGEPLAVRPPTLAQRFWSWTRRQPALASRLGALGLFYGIETVNYLVGATGVDTQFHGRVSVVVALWVAVSIVCQRLLENRRWSYLARYVWGTLDSLALLTVLLIGHGATSSLVIGYPLIIVGSGLWFRVRFVGFMTLLSLLSYGVTVIDFYCWRPELHGRMYAGIDRHIIFAVGLLVLGAVVSYLVERVRVLSSFYGRPA